MILSPSAELLVGLRRDPQYGVHLTIASGGVMAELFKDTQSLILPITQHDITTAIKNLKLASILDGFRNGPIADTLSATDQIFALCNLIETDQSIAAIEINPLIITKNNAIAADAVIWCYDELKEL